MSTENNTIELDDNVELPDDFFKEFEDSKFLDEIVEIVAPAETRVVRTDEVGDDSIETNKSNIDQLPEATEDEPHLKRCLDEINNLTKSIQRRKRKLREEISITENKRSKEQWSRSPSHDSRDRYSPSTSRADRNVRSRDRRSPSRRSPRRRSNGRSNRGRSRSRERNRSRDRRGNRRDRSRSRSESPPRSSTMSFLEELEQKFAEKGQDFPEKELLLRDKANGTSGINPYSVAVTYPQQCEVPICMPPYMQIPMPMPMYNQPYLQQWNGNYMMEPMNTMPHLLPQILPPLPPVNETNMIQNTSKALDKTSTTKAEVVAKCRDASKILRSEENKVPKLRFLFTRTSMPIESSEEQTPPLQSRKNVEFEQTSDNQKPFAPLKFLPPRTRELVKILGYNCSVILDRLRLKEFADKVINEIEDIDTRSKRTKDTSFKEIGMQTESSYKCPNCINSETKSFFNKFVQTDASKKVSIRTQTNEKDYREPLIRSLSRMTPGQLVAVSDFADLICKPRPSTTAEIFVIREKLMDIFNLAERGTEAIEAERGEQDTRRRPLNNSAMISPPLEDLRATLRGSQDHRIPPPPPLLLNYRMDMGMLDAEEEEERIQQMRFEENRRHLEEQRNRGWEHQQLIQQQRQQEEEMRNDRRISFGRGTQNWNGGRGRDRY